MQHYLPEIVWHDREALLSVHLSAMVDGQYKMATTSVRHEVRIWKFAFEGIKNDERQALAVNFIANLSTHKGAVNVARFSPNGEYLVSGDCEGKIVIWRLDSSKPVEIGSSSSNDELPPNKENWIRHKIPLGHLADVCSVCWSPNGQMFSTVSIDESVSVYVGNTGDRLWLIRSFRRFPNGVVWDPRGNYIVTMSTDRKLDIICAKKGVVLRTVLNINLPNIVVGDVPIDAGDYKLFHDDQLMSFSRVADFSPDGELLFAPCAHLECNDKNVFGTYIFRRVDLDTCRPHAFIPSKKPTFRILSCPLLFKLRDDIKGNELNLPYRVIWAVMTRDSVTFYDSQACDSVGHLAKLHYNSLSDIAWSPDGKIMLISSLEGYCSFIKLDLASFGEVYTGVLPELDDVPLLMQSKKTKRSSKIELVGAEGMAKAQKNLAEIGKVKSQKERKSSNITLLSYLKKPQSARIATDEKDNEGQPAEKKVRMNEIPCEVTACTDDDDEVQVISESPKSVIKKRAELFSVPFTKD